MTTLFNSLQFYDVQISDSTDWNFHASLGSTQIHSATFFSISISKVMTTKSSLTSWRIVD